MACWTLSATTTSFNKLITNPHPFSTRPSQLTPLRLSNPVISVTFPSNYRKRNSSAPAAGKGGADDISEFPVGAIVLDVQGMACEGCVTSVKNILESQPQVSSASVDLEKATAIIVPAVEAKVIQDSQTILGNNLAKHLTSCGFESNLQNSQLYDPPRLGAWYLLRQNWLL